MTVDPLLVEAAEDIMSAVSTPAVLKAVERDGWPAAAGAWSAVAEAGLPWISVPEEAGGQGGTLADALAVLRVAGKHSLPLPLAETGILAGWLLAGAGLQVPSGPATVAAGDRAGDAAGDRAGRRAGGLDWDGSVATGSVARVAWGGSAGHVVALIDSGDGPVVALFTTADLRVEKHHDLAAEPRDTLHFDGVAPIATGAAAAGVDAAALAGRGVLTRVVLMAGALDQVLAITLRYTAERKQFGRPIARFQAVQQHLVHIAQQVAKVDMAADLLTEAVVSGADARFAVLAAKAVADDAVTIGTRAAHQAHGAMGMTQEYPLHHATRRLWAWTREYGTGAQAALALGDAVVEAGADDLWPTLTAGAYQS